jgi:hypothetical protein
MLKMLFVAVFARPTDEARAEPTLVSSPSCMLQTLGRTGPQILRRVPHLLLHASSTFPKKTEIPPLNDFTGGATPGRILVLLPLNDVSQYLGTSTLALFPPLLVGYSTGNGTTGEADSTMTHSLFHLFIILCWRSTSTVLSMEGSRGENIRRLSFCGPSEAKARKSFPLRLSMSPKRV